MAGIDNRWSKSDLSFVDVCEKAGRKSGLFVSFCHQKSEPTAKYPKYAKHAAPRNPVFACFGYFAVKNAGSRIGGFRRGLTI
jgi:hypothetical protein